MNGNINPAAEVNILNHMETKHSSNPFGAWVTPPDGPAYYQILGERVPEGLFVHCGVPVSVRERTLAKFLAGSDAGGEREAAATAACKSEGIDEVSAEVLQSGTTWDQLALARLLSPLERELLGCMADGLHLSMTSALSAALQYLARFGRIPGAEEILARFAPAEGSDETPAAE